MTMVQAAHRDAEHAVIEAIRTGDRPAFEEFLRRNNRWVRGVIFGVLGDPDKLDDIAQQVWQTVWARIGDLRNASQWRTWLYRLARNAAVDAGRDQSRRRRLAEQVAGAPVPESPDTPEADAIRREKHQAVLSAIQGLPALYREPFVLRHVEGWSYRQIADAMGMPPATVETRLVRARRLLREDLSGKV